MSENFLTRVRAEAPVVDSVLQEFSEAPIRHYLEHCSGYVEKTLQPRADLGEAVALYVEPLLGARLAERVARDLIQHPVVLTTNHHGVDYFAQSVQGSLLLGLAKKHFSEAATIPVFACGNIPLDNLTYPRGALLYGPVNGSGWPARIPFFSNKLRRQPVSKVRGLDPAMISQAAKRLGNLEPDSVLSQQQSGVLLELLEQEYSAPDIQALGSYSDQSVVLNNRIWQRMFNVGSQMPELVTLELEKITERLLAGDLQNEDSLLSRLLFDDTAMQRLWLQMDGITGCWQCELLEQRWQLRESPSDLKTQGCGSFVFWGVDERNRRIPLFPEWQQQGAVLRGCDDNGRSVCFALEPEIILNELKTGRLMPTLFTSFAVIALARGVTCLGGYYQGEYLQEIQYGITTVMRDIGQSEDAIALVDAVKTDGYLSGMQTILFDHGGALLPAGITEIIATGKINEAELKRISEITVGDAHRASLAETVPDLLGSHSLVPDELKDLAAEHFTTLSESIVLRSL